MTLSSEIGILEDKVADLTTRLSQCENALAFERGKNEQLDQINAKLQATLSVRETALALYEAAKRTNGAEPMPAVAHLQKQLEDLSDDPMPKFLQNTQIAAPTKATDRRVPRHAA